MKEEMAQLRKLYGSYKNIHEQISDLEKDLLSLESRRSTLIEILKRTREEELSIINKLEVEHGRTITPDDLLEMLNSHE